MLYLYQGLGDSQAWCILYFPDPDWDKLWPHRCRGYRCVFWRQKYIIQSLHQFSEPFNNKIIPYTRYLNIDEILWTIKRYEIYHTAPTIDKGSLKKEIKVIQNKHTNKCKIDTQKSLQVNRRRIKRRRKKKKKRKEKNN